MINRKIFCKSGPWQIIFIFFVCFNCNVCRRDGSCIRNSIESSVCASVPAHRDFPTRTDSTAAYWTGTDRWGFSRKSHSWLSADLQSKNCALTTDCVAVCSCLGYLPSRGLTVITFWPSTTIDNLNHINYVVISECFLQVHALSIDGHVAISSV